MWWRQIFQLEIDFEHSEFDIHYERLEITIWEKNTFNSSMEIAVQKSISIKLHPEKENWKRCLFGYIMFVLWDNWKERGWHLFKNVNDANTLSMDLDLLYPMFFWNNKLSDIVRERERERFLALIKLSPFITDIEIKI